MHFQIGAFTGALPLLQTVLLSALPLFGLVAIGYLARRKRVLHLTDSDVLNRFVMEISLPALILDSILSKELRPEYIKLPFVIWISQTGVFVLALLVAKMLRYSPKQTGTTVLVGTFGNTGYLGYPMTMALFPQLLPATVIMDQLGMGTPLYPTAAVLGSIFGRAGGASIAKSLARTFRSPIMIALIVGIVLRAIPWPHLLTASTWRESYLIGEIAAVEIGKCIHVLGAATIPTILISLGIILRPSALKDCIPQVGVIAVLKLVVAPILGFLVTRYLLGIHDPELTSVCVLECALPPSANATLFCGQYDMDGTLGVAAFFALTLGSALTIPLVLAFLR